MLQLCCDGRLPPAVAQLFVGLICCGFMCAVITSRSCVARFNLHAPASSTEKTLDPFVRLSFLSHVVLSGDWLKSAFMQPAPDRLVPLSSQWSPLIQNTNQLKESSLVSFFFFFPKIRCNSCCFLNFTGTYLWDFYPFCCKNNPFNSSIFKVAKTPHSQQSH